MARAPRFWDTQHTARQRTRGLLLGFFVCVLLCLATVHLGLTLAWWLLFHGWPYHQYLPVPLVRLCSWRSSDVCGILR